MLSSLRLPKKTKRILSKSLTEEEQKDIHSRYFRQRVWANLLVISMVGGSSFYVIKDYADSRVSPINATEALNKQDELQEQEDIIYEQGEVISGSNAISSETGESYSGKRVTESDSILLVGMDTREGKNGEIGAGNAVDIIGTRTDSVMFLHIPKSGGKPSIVSFPRDLSVDRQDCNEWKGSGYGDIIEGDKDVKLNSIYGVGGPRCLVRTVQKITGMKINRFVAVDFSGFTNIVDAIGGVDIQVDKPLIDDELGTIVEEPGLIHFDGANALNFVRARKIEGEVSGDYDRINRQQMFGQAVLKKVSSSGTLSNPAKLNGLSDAIYTTVSGENIDSNFILNILKRAGEFESLGVDNHTIPTSGTDEETGNEIIDESAKDDMMAAIATGE